MSEHSVRGWKASELAERSLVGGRTSSVTTMFSRSSWVREDGVYHGSIAMGMSLLLIIATIIIWSRGWVARDVAARARQMITMISPGTWGGAADRNALDDCSSIKSNTNDHHDGHEDCTSTKEDEKKIAVQKIQSNDASAVVVDNGSDERQVCVQSLSPATTSVLTSTELLATRVEEATMTLSSIHARIPENMSRKEKVAMTHMMLEAMKVNEACRSSASMERMECIAEKGVTIQSNSYDMNIRRYRDEEIKKTARDVAKVVLDIMFTGVLIMVLSGGCTAWYGGTLGRKTRMCTASSTFKFFYGRVVSDLVQIVSLTCCYLVHLVRALQAVVVLILTPLCISKIGVYRKVDDMPIFTLLVTFSGICGVSGTYVVSWLGGSSMMWLVMWQLWVASCLGCLCLSSRISQYSIPSRSKISGNIAQKRGEDQGWQPWRRVCIFTGMWMVLAVLYPVLMGVLALR